jgi:two-component system phosphate regulon sensor histidine kinase PhoR
MRRDFVSGVSHELKTPLTVIQACTDTLMEGAVDDPVAAKRFLTQISEQSERLLELILGMLQLSRVESGAEVFEMGPLDAAEIVRDVIDGFQPVAESRTVRLEQAGLTELTVEADPQALRTIVSNLVDNAIKYTAENGTVSVLLEHDADGKHLIVRDTGIGMAAEHLPRVFERFYRVDRGRSRDRGGTGLGLSIVKHL